jgi:hypothetical protein
VEQGYITLKSPPGLTFTDVWLASGRRVQPDPCGHIHVAPSEASALLSYGWMVVQPLPPPARWKPPTAA